MNHAVYMYMYMTMIVLYYMDDKTAAYIHTSAAYIHTSAAYIHTSASDGNSGMKTTASTATLSDACI